jgi:diguanylate cyclase
MNGAQPGVVSARTLVRRELAVIAVFCAVFLSWLALKSAGQATSVSFDNVLQGIGEAIGFLFALPLLAGTGKSRQQRLVCWLLALAILSYCIGQAIWTVNEDVLHLAVLFPSWADAGWLASFPLVLAAILLLPARSLPGVTRAKVVLDGLIMMGALAIFSWYFILGPTVLNATGSLFVKWVSAAYPLATLVLIFCLVFLVLSVRDRSLGMVVRFLTVGLCVIVVTDSIYGYQQIHGTYATGSVLDLGWPLGYMLIGLAAGVMRLVPSMPDAASLEQPGDEPSNLVTLWQLYLPYALFGATALLTLYSWLTAVDSLQPVLFAGTFLLVMLVVTRQVMALVENRHLLLVSMACASRLERLNTELHVMATTDALTGLPNRTLLHDRVEQALRTADRQGHEAALLLMDLDRFKEVNDTLGHALGDHLLFQVGHRLREALRAEDTVARPGGDEFAMLLPDADLSGALQVVDSLQRVFDQPFTLEGQVLHVRASIGVALAPNHGTDAAALLRCADVAMYVAKRAGSGHAVYDANEDPNTSDRLALIGDLRRAIAEGGLEVHYQPIVDQKLARIIAVEALVRWPHPERGFLSPGEFIPLAEHSGLIGELTWWILERAVDQLCAWHRAGWKISVAVNLSMQMLQDQLVSRRVIGLLVEYGLPPEWLTLEVTESALMVDRVRTLDVLQQLADAGVRIAIDDFGTGYSSLAYVKNLPVHQVKIDRIFVKDLGRAHNKGDEAIVRSVLAMAHALDLHVVAEGVEDVMAWDYLASLGCDMAQGFYMARPLPIAQLEEWIERSEWGFAAELESDGQTGRLGAVAI